MVTIILDLARAVLRKVKNHKNVLKLGLLAFLINVTITIKALAGETAPTASILGPKAPHFFSTLLINFREDKFSTGL